MGAGPVEIGALVPKGQANVDVVYELLDQSGLNPHKSSNPAVHVVTPRTIRDSST
jgi:hypothetical protein